MSVKCEKCGVEMDSGAIYCGDFYKGHVCYDCCTKCKFKREAGITISICTYRTQLARFKAKNIVFYASPFKEKEIYEAFKVGEMTDTGLSMRYEDLYRKYLLGEGNSLARQGNRETLFVLAKEIEKRGLFGKEYKKITSE